MCTNSSEPSIAIAMTTGFPTIELEKSNLACQSSALGISFSQRGLTDLYPCMGESQQHFFIGQDPQELSYCDVASLCGIEHVKAKL
jgi:hypothetical protein